MRHSREYVPHHEKKEPVYDLPLELASVEEVFSNCADFASREIALAEGSRGTVCWVDGLIKSERLNDYVLRPLIAGPVPAAAARWNRCCPEGCGT